MVYIARDITYLLLVVNNGLLFYYLIKKKNEQNKSLKMRLLNIYFCFSWFCEKSTIFIESVPGAPQNLIQNTWHSGLNLFCLVLLLLLGWRILLFDRPIKKNKDNVKPRSNFTVIYWFNLPTKYEMNLQLNFFYYLNGCHAGKSYYVASVTDVYILREEQLYTQYVALM